VQRTTARTGAGRGSVTVVGLGIQVPAHVTAETRAAIERADEVFCLLADPVAISWLESVNPRVRALHGLYEPGKERRQTYDAVVEAVLARVRRGRSVCVAFYGHPGVFVDPSHEMIRQARRDGFDARMLPAVSAEDCLFAELGVDPGRAGCQSYEATDFLLRERRVDPSAALILWQIGVVGNLTFVPEGDMSRLPVLVEYLGRYYPPQHDVVLYEASVYPVCDPLIRRVKLAELPDADISPIATLYVPPMSRATSVTMRKRLGIVPAEPQAGVAADSASVRA
jgi:uncharacterized protein YabN with tetrapyrrole methylase and pyrophosphatase domain